MILAKLFGRFKNLDGEVIGYAEKNEREEICKACPNYRKDFVYMYLFKKEGLPQCGVCKCSISDKTLWKSEKCPKGKW